MQTHDGPFCTLRFSEIPQTLVHDVCSTSNPGIQKYDFSTVVVTECKHSDAPCFLREKWAADREKHSTISGSNDFLGCITYRLWMIGANGIRSVSQPAHFIADETLAASFMPARCTQCYLNRQIIFLFLFFNRRRGRFCLRKRSTECLRGRRSWRLGLWLGLGLCLGRRESNVHRTLLRFWSGRILRMLAFYTPLK